MKTIGLIGGTSWESTAVYYRLLNQGVRERVGGLTSAEIVMVSLDFAPLAAAMAADRWAEVGDRLTAAARQLESGGADCVALCTNTMHKLAPALVAATPLPFIDIRVATGRALAAHGSTQPLLLATRYTMEQAFYRDHLRDTFGIEAAIPPEADRSRLQTIIFDELCRGVVDPGSKAEVLKSVDAAAADGCDALIFGCTEIGMLLAQDDTRLPVFDTTDLHCAALLDFALSSPLPQRHAA